EPSKPRRASGEGRGVLAREPVAHPDDIGGAVEGEPLQARKGGAAVDRPWPRDEGLRGGAGVGWALDRGGARRLAAGKRRGVDERHLAVLALGLRDELRPPAPPPPPGKGPPPPPVHQRPRPGDAGNPPG